MSIKAENNNSECQNPEHNPLSFLEDNKQEITKSKIGIEESSPSQWKIIGASVTGYLHKNNNKPCQDAHRFLQISPDMGIIVVSDGAGSSEFSQLSSNHIVNRCISLFSDIFHQKMDLNKPLPCTDNEWRSIVLDCFSTIHQELTDIANEISQPVSALHATVICAVFSTSGIYIAFVGDGRAGYQDLEGNWYAAMEPSKGDQVGETNFITQDIVSNPELINTKVIDSEIKSIVVLTDGCENSVWMISQRDDVTGNIINVNLPYSPFFNSNIQTLKDLYNDLSADDIGLLWVEYLSSHRVFSREEDDKTLVIAFLDT
jgi:hypothetical protein